MNNEQPLFSACYSNWRVIQGRKVVQLIFEVPIEASDHAYRVLGGMPNNGEEKYFAIARLEKKPNS